MTQPADSAQVSVRDAPERNRFEIWVGDDLAGFTLYRAESRAPGPVWAFTHTEIGDAFGGRGLASILIKDALDEMRKRGIAVLPFCPFVRRYISRHAEYLDLVPAQDRARFDLAAEAEAEVPKVPGG